MSEIPIYLKTDADMPRPSDPEYYVIAANGTFFGRNHPFFSSDAPTRRAPRSLAHHEPQCRLRYPRLGTAALEYIVGFFDRVYERHGSESIVLLYWNQQRRRYKLWVPEQEATVWESYSGIRSALDVTYKTPLPPPPGHLLVADIHCHCDFGAHASFTDEKDEQYRDGVHAIVGHIDREPPEFHLEMAIDGYRFRVDFDQLFRGYRRRRRDVPERWLDRLTVKVKRPQSWGYGGGSSYGGSSHGESSGSSYGGNSYGSGSYGSNWSDSASGKKNQRRKYDD